MGVTNNIPLTLVRMVILNGAEVRAVIRDPKASLTLETGTGSIQVEVHHTEEVSVTVDTAYNQQLR